MRASGARSTFARAAGDLLAARASFPFSPALDPSGAVFLGAAFSPFSRPLLFWR